MDKTTLVKEVADLFSISGYSVKTSVRINHREIDVYAEEQQNIVRKIILVECADYSATVGISKLQEDINKLNSAREILKSRAIAIHVSRNGYSPDALGYANEAGIDVFSLFELKNQLVNFDKYIEAIEHDPSRQIIQSEYQPNRIHFEGKPKTIEKSIVFLDNWLKSDTPWLTILGDYGVGKSWTIKRYLFHLVEKYKQNPAENLLPFFVPLQNFTKSFDFQNLILRCFQIYGLGGVYYKSFEHLMLNGKIIFLLDSFDEMAQHLNRIVIRENLNELLTGISKSSKTIMTSRPNYFEGRAERLLVIERDGNVEWHPIDDDKHVNLTALSGNIRRKLESVQFCRIQDLTNEQRLKLFEIVLGKDSKPYKRLIDLFHQFQNLENISQKAVIARLLTTVATTLSESKEVTTIEGYSLLPEDLQDLNESKIFEIVLYNLLFRDQGIGVLNTGQRIIWLRQFAVYLQRKEGTFFARPDEIRAIVNKLFYSDINRSDTPSQVLEGYYRTCRRHSGLTTEGQFKDTSGMVDTPVDEHDSESNVGFSHNSLREFLVADAFSDFLTHDRKYDYLENVIVSDTVSDFFSGITTYRPELVTFLREKYLTEKSSKLRESLFKLLFGLIKNNRENVSLLGNPAVVTSVDLSDYDLSGLNLSHSIFRDCIALGTDFRKSDLRNAVFHNCLFEQITLDDALLSGCNMMDSEIISLYVFDQFSSKTSAIISGRDARQWLFTKGVKLKETSDLNPYIGQAWYEAAREVTVTIVKRIAGTHQDISLAKGTKIERREFAKFFVEFLVRRKVLKKVRKSNTGPGYVVQLDVKYRNDIEEFSRSGRISKILAPFFNKYLPEEFRNNTSKYYNPFDE